MAKMVEGLILKQEVVAENYLLMYVIFPEASRHLHIIALPPETDKLEGEPAEWTYMLDTERLVENFEKVAGRLAALENRISKLSS